MGGTELSVVEAIVWVGCVLCFAVGMVNGKQR